MTELLKRLVRSGIAASNPFAGSAQYIRPRRGDARQDFAVVAGDMRAIGRDFRRTAQKQLTRDGKPAHRR